MDKGDAVAVVRFPPVPALDDELLKLADERRLADPAPPPPAAVAQAQTYLQYVVRLAGELDRQSRALVIRMADEIALKQTAYELAVHEARRQEGMRVFLAGSGAQPGLPATPAGMLLGRLREGVARELEAWRDARLRLEVRRAELINQKAPPQVRIVLKGSGQLRLHFQMRKQQNAAPKG